LEKYPILPGAWQFRYDTNFAFVVKLRRTGQTVVIVTSAGALREAPTSLVGVEADMVFLSIGNFVRLKKEEKDDYVKYWVTDTKAKIVIPIHWDNLAGSISKNSLKLAPKPFDDVCAALRELKARTNKVSLMPLTAPVKIPAAQK
jgi:hypothetical protein